ncbi:valine--tRNA ligase [Bacteroidia bacterium]|nr:valine--tRNA ligase [Bacteroidia bacterium]
MKNAEISQKYSPVDIEDKWYAHWIEKNYFHSEPDSREPYCVVIPPPNVTGVLHMGHMLNNTIQDVLVRRARMLGKNACWVPGTDHASIATEAKVVAKLKEEGIDKYSLSREEFLNHAWEWKNKHGGIILSQLKKLGASCDWQRTKFTMDEDLYESVIKVFVDLFNKGLIYRGVRMVNWDPQALTAVSDEEVIHKEVQSKLYYLKYAIVSDDDTHKDIQEFVNIATTRPETILGDTAICCNPNDERYKHLKGKKVVVPLVNRVIPIIFDEYVDTEFGTGCLKITPAHDINDYNIGLKYKLDSIDIFNDNGTINDKVGLYVGEDRFVVRKKIVKDLENAGFLQKIEEYTNSVGFSERTDAVIEPKLSLQWFLKMENLAKPALEVVMNDTIQFFPSKFKNMYRHWMENVKDWNISRQLWWGQQIPAYYLPNREFVVAENADEALRLAQKKYPELNLSASDLKQDEDVLDTWFSSWLWPMSVFDGVRNPDNKDIQYYYPTCDLVTAPEIIFFWVARMIIAGIEYRKEVPFKNVYFTGIVRDKLGRKMSKSLGNSPDPIELMKVYGADGTRMGLMLTSPAGNDLPFDESICELGRNFCNKLWNAMRLINGWDIDESIAQPDYCKNALNWFDAQMNMNIATINEHFDKFRINDAMLDIYKLTWDEFCSWLLEMLKPAYGQPIDKKTHTQLLNIFAKLLKLLHPFMPFITEEIWHVLDLSDNTDIIVAPYPQAEKYDENIIMRFNYAKEVIAAIRNVRKEKNIPQKDSIRLFVKKNNNEKNDDLYDNIVLKLCNIETIDDAINFENTKPHSSFIIGSTEFFVPMTESVDIAEEIKKLEVDLVYYQGFLQQVDKKLSNEKFVSSAPANIVDAEKKKQADAISKIKVIEEKLKMYKNA